MQRCLVQWVSGGKKPSGHPADRGMACCPDACCSRTRNKESFWRPWPPLSPWILDRSSPPFHRSPVPCRARFVRALDPALALPRSREKFTYGGPRSRKYRGFANGPLAQSHFPRLSAGIFLRLQKFISIHWYKILCTCIRVDLWI